MLWQFTQQKLIQKKVCFIALLAQIGSDILKLSSPNIHIIFFFTCKIDLIAKHCSRQTITLHFRHSEFIYHGIKSKSGSDATEKERKKKWHHYKQMLYEDTDAGLVRMFECFLEAAPQLVLQLFILFREIIENGVDGNNDLVEHGHMSKHFMLSLFSNFIFLSNALPVRCS